MVFLNELPVQPSIVSKLAAPELHVCSRLSRGTCLRSSHCRREEKPGGEGEGEGWSRMNATHLHREWASLHAHASFKFVCM